VAAQRKYQCENSQPHISFSQKIFPGPAVKTGPFSLLKWSANAYPATKQKKLVIDSLPVTAMAAGRLTVNGIHCRQRAPSYPVFRKDGKIPSNLYQKTKKMTLAST
jgi:hypothetical protein